jgi:hypothetical protein
MRPPRRLAVLGRVRRTQRPRTVTTARLWRRMSRVVRYPITVACLSALVLGAVTYLVSPKPFEERAILFTANPQAPNPYVNVGRGQYAVSEVVARRILADASIRNMQRHGQLAAFTLEIEQNLNEPLLHITVRGRDRNVVVATLRTVIAEAQHELVLVQNESGSPAAQRFEYTVIAETPVPEISRRDAIQRAIEAFLGVFLVSYLIGLAVSSYRRYRDTLCATDETVVSEIGAAKEADPRGDAPQHVTSPTNATALRSATPDDAAVSGRDGMQTSSTAAGDAPAPTTARDSSPADGTS